MTTPNAISVDVEEYFHATNLDPYVGRERWDTMPSRLEASMDQTLELFSRTETSGTFFVLGVIAEKFPQIVSRLQELGHEVASHGYDHRCAFDQTPEEFYQDVTKTKQLLENITGTEVLGYRAPNFSILDSNQWAYDKLIEAGYRYDSSVYPIWHPRYANRGQSRVPTVIKRTDGSITEIPLSTSAFSLFGKELRLPIAGGAYWRLFPLQLIRAALKRLNKKEGLSICGYFHPWEVDQEQPVIEEIGLLTKLRHYGGSKQFPHKLESLLKQFDFVPIRQLLENGTSSGDQE